VLEISAERYFCLPLPSAGADAGSGGWLGVSQRREAHCRAEQLCPDKHFETAEKSLSVMMSYSAVSSSEQWLALPTGFYGTQPILGTAGVQIISDDTNLT